MGHGLCERFTAVGSALAVLAGLLVVVQVAPAAGAEPSRLLVTYADATESAEVAAGFRTVSVIADEHRSVSQVQVLEFASASAATRAARELVRDPEVLHVEPDAVIRLSPPDVPTGPLTLRGEFDALLTETASTSTLTPQTWPIHNRGQFFDGKVGRRGVDVGAVDAWPYATGRGVVVAVIDTGVDIDHPQLKHRIWRNTKERADGRDTDGNGFVDDLNGWNFVHHDNQVFRDAPADLHGTIVAGTIVAARDPATGMTGVAPDARIMPLKFIDGHEGLTSGAIAAVRYAAANGADIINASFGNDQASVALQTAIAESGLPVVAAAGNHGASLDLAPMYPAAFPLPNLVAVAAVDHAGALAPFSGFSPRIVDVAAPGMHVYSTIPGGGFQFASGTSVSAPLVSGTLALALQRHPDTEPAALLDALRRSSRPLAGASKTVAGGIVMAPALLALLGTDVPVCSVNTLTRFSDVSPTSTHSDAVGCLVATGTTVGTTATTFSPAGNLTRGQVASLLARIIDRAGLLPPPPTTHRFVDATSSHADNLERLAALEILRISGDRVYPNGVVSRAEFATLAARTAELISTGTIRLELYPELSGGGFADLASTSTRDEVLKATAIRVTLGRTADSFAPETPVRRDQAASMLVRLLARIGEQGLVDPV